MLTIPSLLGKWHPQTCSTRAARNPHSVEHKAQENEVCLVGVRKIRVQMEGVGAQDPSATSHLEEH